ncbi:tetratricopeptide repeat protein [Myxococcota bacterium]
MLRTAVWALLPLAIGLGACRPALPADSEPRSATPFAGPLRPVVVSETEFPTRVREILARTDHSPQTLNLLAGVVVCQLRRASSRFETGGPEAGLRAVTGALYLLQANTFRHEMLRGSEAALAAAARETARVGSEGRSLAAYQMLLPLLQPGPTRTDVLAHLQALASWSRTLESSGVMQSAGARQRIAVDRALFEPTHEALAAAHRATAAWVDQSLALDRAERSPPSGMEPDEIMEAMRARRLGAVTLVALYLRHGDVDGAWRALTQVDARLVPRGLADVLERAAQDGEREAWFELHSNYSAAAQANDSEITVDPELALAAAWGSAVELYRLDPDALSAAKIMANLLFEYGMADVAPEVLAKALPKRATAQDIAYSLSVVLRSIVKENGIGQLAAARRAFRSAEPLLKLGRQTASVQRSGPTPARIYYVMGAIEVQAGELARARPLVQAASQAAPTTEASMLLAAIERQRGAYRTALRQLADVVRMTRGKGDEPARTEAHLMAFEIHREMGNRTQAESALSQALVSALAARRGTDATESPRTERVLARTLEYYGDREGASRATHRAYEAARSDSREMTATVLDAARRAFNLRDVRAARAAVRQGLEAGMDGDDLVYVTLWLLALERTLGESSDGTVEETLAALELSSEWTKKLRAWARGRLSAQTLLESARTRTEQTEATFYAAFDDKAGLQRDSTLAKVAQSETIELVEAAIARDWVARSSPARDFGLPTNVKIP